MAFDRTLLVAVLISLASVTPVSAFAEVTETKVEYKADDTIMVGYFYSDSAVKGDAPAILVFSDWLGVGDFAKERAKELAAKGYRAFVADIYGGAKLASGPSEAGELATKFKSDRPLTRDRAKAGFYTLLKQPGVDAKKIGSIGFCFGGMVALELARLGVPVAATVSFHGTLNTPNATLAKNIVGQVLVLHGANDPFVNEAEVRAFEEEMRTANVTWQIVKYGGAVHAYTNPNVGTDPFSGAAYHELAAKRSYVEMYNFFKEVLGI